MSVMLPWGGTVWLDLGSGTEHSKLHSSSLQDLQEGRWEGCSGGGNRWKVREGWGFL